MSINIFVTSSNIAATIAGLNANAVNYLNLQGLPLAQFTSAFWVALTNCASLTGIQCGGRNLFGDRGVQLMVDTLRANVNSKGIFFGLDDTNCTDVGANAVVDLMRNGPPGLLNYISLDNNPLITDVSGVNLMAAIPFCPGLQYMSISGCRVGDATAQMFAQRVLTQTSTFLGMDFYTNNIGIVGAQSVLDALPNSKIIEYVNLINNPYRNPFNDSFITAINAVIASNANCSIAPTTCPLITKCALNVNPYDLTSVTPRNISFTDVRGNALPVPENAHIFVNATTGGYFCLVHAPDAALSQFNMAQVNASEIAFRYTGGSAGQFLLPSFMLSGVYNGTRTPGAVSGTVGFSMTPTVAPTIASTTTVATPAPSLATNTMAETSVTPTAVATNASATLAVTTPTTPAPLPVTNATMAPTMSPTSARATLTQAAASPETSATASASQVFSSAAPTVFATSTHASATFTQSAANPETSATASATQVISSAATVPPTHATFFATAIPNATQAVTRLSLAVSHDTTPAATINQSIVVTTKLPNASMIMAPEEASASATTMLNVTLISIIASVGGLLIIALIIVFIVLYRRRIGLNNQIGRNLKAESAKPSKAFRELMGVPETTTDSHAVNPLLLAAEAWKKKTTEPDYLAPYNSIDDTYEAAYSAVEGTGQEHYLVPHSSEAMYALSLMEASDDALYTMATDRAENTGPIYDQGAAAEVQYAVNPNASLYTLATSGASLDSHYASVTNQTSTEGRLGVAAQSGSIYDAGMESLYGGGVAYPLSRGVRSGETRFSSFEASETYDNLDGVNPFEDSAHESGYLDCAPSNDSVHSSESDGTLPQKTVVSLGWPHGSLGLFKSFKQAEPSRLTAEPHRPGQETYPL